MSEMKNLKCSLSALLLGLVALAASPMVAADDLASLRGTRTIDTLSANPERAAVILPDDGEHKRSFDGQPPMIPHKVKPGRISLRTNQCLECHGAIEYKDLEAPLVHESHFVNRAGEDLGSVSTRFYFCNQCHAPQLDKTPLVTNTFTP
jgi:cytochrome c-type protein NapB